MWKKRLIAVLVLLLATFVGYFVAYSEPKAESSLPVISSPAWFSKFPFKLGLDLSGGTHLVYRADVSKLESDSVTDSLESLRDVIERRVNAFGVSEPVVQVEVGGSISTDKYRLIVDLPGVTDVNEAIKLIGATPILEFKTEKPGAKEIAQNATPDENGNLNIKVDDIYQNTKLTGQYLKNSRVDFNSTTGVPNIVLKFDEEGSKLFAQITKENIGKTVAIFLDGQIISSPTVQGEIDGGEAVITGTFDIKEAKALVGKLNSGALPVPVELITTQTIGPILGSQAIDAGLKAALIGFMAIAIFLLIWYRLPGFIAVISLAIYVLVVLAIFKVFSVVLTSAGIAGFIISLGIAVDANILIFERLKEEIRSGRSIYDAVEQGFDKAWFSIRDANTSTLITSAILYYFGTSLIKGFALTLAIGVIVSLFSAITVTRVFLRSIKPKTDSRVSKFLFSSGFVK